MEDACPAADAWYLAAAMHAKADFWISHEHKDGLVAIAAKHVTVRLLSRGSRRLLTRTLRMSLPSVA